MWFNSSKGRNGASIWAMQHLAWMLTALATEHFYCERPTKALWHTGLRKERVTVVSSSEKEDFKLGLLEQRVKTPLKEGTDNRFYFQYIWYKFVARKLYCLTLETFCLKPRLGASLVAQG